MSHSERLTLNPPRIGPKPGELGNRDGLLNVINKTRDTEIGSGIEVAKSASKRSKGLLGRKDLQAGGGMWIVPCEAIHTFFMQFSIDVVYLDKNLRVKKLIDRLPPWRLSACLAAHSVLELPPGTIRSTRTQRGDILEIMERE